MLKFKFLWETTGALQIKSGLRIILLFAVPLFICEAFFHNNLGIFIGLGGYPLILADVAIFYYTRFQAMVLITIIGAFSIFLGSLISSILWLKIVVTFLWLFAAGYFSVYGQVGVMTGVVLALFFLFAIDLPPTDILDAFLRSSVAIVGSIWAMIICLGLWPLQAFQPLKKSASNCYKQMSLYLLEFQAYYFLKGVNSDEAQKSFLLKQTIQEARDVLTYNRQGRLGRSVQGELTAILIEEADSLMSLILSLVELVELHHQLPQFLTINILISESLEQLSLINQQIANLILNKKTPISFEILVNIINALRQQLQLQEKTINPAENPGYLALVNLIKLLENIYNKLTNIIAIIEDFENPNTTFVKRKSKKTSFLPSFTLLFEPLKDNFCLKSSLFRHALRLSIVTGSGVIIKNIFNIPEGFWIYLTIVLVLQPDFGKTFQRFFHRVIGTILGAILAPIILSYVTLQSLNQIITIISLAVGITFLKFHYAIGVFFISIFVITLKGFDPSVDSWKYAFIRIGCTVLGASLSFFGYLLLFPDNQKEKLSSVLSKSLDASCNYFLSVMEMYLGKVKPQLSVINSYQREARLSYFNAQVALQSAINDPHTKTRKIEPIITLISYISRFNRATTLLKTQRETHSQIYPTAELEEFTLEVERVLCSLASAIAHQNLPLELLALDRSLANIEQRLAIWQSLLHSNPNHSLILDYTLIKTELDAMVDRLKAMYSAVVRINL